jgi:hypothetical protein
MKGTGDEMRVAGYNLGFVDNVAAMEELDGAERWLV